MTETGAGSLGLAVRAGKMTSLRSTLGITLQRHFATGWDGITATPRGRLGWAHEFADAVATTEASLLGAPAAPFRLASARTGRDAALLGAGASVGIGPAVSVFLDYAAELRSNFTSQAIGGGLQVAF